MGICILLLLVVVLLIAYYRTNDDEPTKANKYIRNIERVGVNDRLIDGIVISNCNWFEPIPLTLMCQFEISHATHYCGSGFGAVYCLFLSVGYDVSSIRDYLISNREILESISTISEFESFIQSVLAYKYIDIDCTLMDLYIMKGTKLTTVVFNYTNQSVEYLNYLTNPNLSVVKAVLLSCAYPIMFPNMMYNDMLYYSGLYANSYPYNYILQDCDNPLGIHVLHISTKSGKDDAYSKLYNTILNIKYRHRESIYPSNKGIQIAVTCYEQSIEDTFATLAQMP